MVYVLFKRLPNFTLTPGQHVAAKTRWSTLPAAQRHFGNATSSSSTLAIIP